jgi:HK97 family phage portal protein
MLTISGGSISIAPQMLAEFSPIVPESYYYPEALGMDLEYRYALYGEIYLHQPWITAVINKRAEAVSRLPVNVWDIKGDTRQLDTRSAYARLISDPCPKMDPFSFWGWVQRTIDIYGETFLAIVRDGNDQPISLFPMHPSRIAIKRNPKDGDYTYYFQAGSGIGTELVHFAERDVVPFKLFNPNKLERGMSKMEALRSTIFAEDSSRTATSAMWKNAGRPNMVLSTQNRLGEAGRKRLKLAFDQSHAGSSNAGQTLVLEDGVTATAMQVSAVDMQYIEARQLNREEVCGVYDVAPPMVHILDRATFSNISAQMRAFYRDTMAPPLEFLQSVMNKYVGSQWGRPNLMEFAVDDVIRGDFETRMEAAHKGVSTAVMTPNESRDMIGLNRYDDPKADKLYANSAIQPLGEPAEQVRIMGQLTGPTPDGVGGPPPAVPVAGLEGGKPTAIPKPGGPNPPKPAGGPQPNNSNPSSMPKPKHLRAVKGEVGRGRTDDELVAFAFKLYREYPEDLDDIMTAVKLAIAERDKKETTT